MRHDVRPALRLLARTLAFLLAGLGGTAVARAELHVSPTEIRLDDAFSRRQIQVEAGDRDATRQATYRSTDANVAIVDAAGYVTPLADGSTQILVEHAGETATIAVQVAGMQSGRAVDFGSDIEPLLSRFGCNSGGCHGKASGQNGFKLSLFGFDQEFDHESIARQAKGRRIFPASPDESLLLRKAANLTPHGGGARFSPDSEAYQMVRTWIARGAPPALPEAPRVVGLSVSPGDRIMQAQGTQQLAILAEYSDGSVRDVTRQAEYSSNMDTVAAVNVQGLVSATGHSGEAAVMARYMGSIAVFRAIVPHGEPLAKIPGFTPNNYLDELVAQKWGRLGLTPSPVCDDSTFLRRLTVDLCGRLPTVDEATAFLDDESPNKRLAAIDRLLESPDYPAFFALRWSVILRNSKLAGAEQTSYAFHNWIKDLIARNRPYDELVRGVVAAAGEWSDAPAINWYWQMRDDQLHQVTADTAQVFLGVRLQCARCHHHPYEQWSQEDYYGLSGFFTRLGRKSFGQPPPYYNASKPTTSEKNPLTVKTPEPKFLNGEYAQFTPEEDPRHALVDWMVQPDNPYFSTVLVNRLWGHFLGRGLVHQVDDLRASNPPSNPELLDALARDFVEHKFDMKHIIRTIVSSRVYQLSSDPTPANALDRQNYARFYARRMIAEVFHDAVDQTCGVKTRFGNISDDARAVDLPHEGFGSYFLDTFDRPNRVSGCECERSAGATLAQVLLLANSGEIENKLTARESRLSTLLAAKKTPQEIVEEIYLAAYSRRPTDAEAKAIDAYLASEENPQRGLEDVLWTVLNSKEFMFNH
ncbi:DUF1549 and DUF1553 domain-containing protein [Lignipirellula cremea]|nr:DUF1549 and DUF1553 domain-containing protein [Lignipirellula cremea]